MYGYSGRLFNIQSFVCINVFFLIYLIKEPEKYVAGNKKIGKTIGVPS